MAVLTHDEKVAVVEAAAAAHKALAAVDGPYSLMKKAFDALDELECVALDGDEVFSGCECCDDIIFISEADAGGVVTTEDGCVVCPACVARWEKDARAMAPEGDG